jgi:hypothetical protein
MWINWSGLFPAQPADERRKDLGWNRFPAELADVRRMD